MSAATAPLSIDHSWTGRVWRVVPGMALCVGVTGVALAAQMAEAKLFGRAWLESLVLAILLGTAIRTAWAPGDRWRPGVAFSAHTLLEVAVVLLGASVSVAAILRAGPWLLVGIGAVVAVAICGSYGLGRFLGLKHRLAVLIACGNSICGNSAIAAVAPVIGADGEDVASSIAFTAVLGVVVVLALPLLSPLLHLSAVRYGVLAGMTVYAVPQVLAATAPFGATALHVGTLVKLVRVLMLGPVVLVLSALTRRRHDQPARGRPPLRRMVPWFIVGFLALAAIRSTGVIPDAALPAVATVATWLTVVSMAALGLCTDVRVVARAGARVVATVTLSLLGLGAISLGLIALLGI